MPPLVSYILVAPNTAVPVRVFVDRRKVLSLSDVAINEKSVLTLCSINLLRLSNADLASLLLDIRPALKHLLLAALLRDLFPGRPVLRSLKTAKDFGVAWKCKVVVSLGYIVDLRYRLSCLQGAADLDFLREKNIEVDLRQPARPPLLCKSLRFVAGDLTDEATETDKKSLSYKLQACRLVNSSVVDTLDVFVGHRP